MDQEMGAEKLHREASELLEKLRYLALFQGFLMENPVESHGKAMENPWFTKIGIYRYYNP